MSIKHGAVILYSGEEKRQITDTCGRLPQMPIMMDNMLVKNRAFSLGQKNAALEFNSSHRNS